MRKQQLKQKQLANKILLIVLSILFLQCASKEQQQTLDFSSSNFDMHSLELKSIKQEEDSILSFQHSEDHTIQLKLRGQNGDLALENTSNNFDLFTLNNTHFKIASDTCKIDSLQFKKDFIYNGVLQWKLWYQEDYFEKPSGWTNNDISTCGGIYMLGGYNILSAGEITKIFDKIPEHKFIRIVANYHFIDAWSGESGFMRVNLGQNQNMEYVWTEKYDYSKAIDSIDVCGAQYGEGYLNAAIDVSFAHNLNSIKIGFGSTLEDDDPMENSFGISGLQIFIK